MRLIRPNCRVQLTAADIDFILDTLQPGVRTKDCLERLLADEDTRDLILDDDQILRAVLEHRGCLRISTHFYFYVLVRHVFRQCGLAERSVADYVAELLSTFSQAESSQLKLHGNEASIDYFSDMLAALRDVDELTGFFVRAHMGNLSLFLSGIFPDRIRHRAEYRGAPGLEFYEALGRSSFRIASDHRLAQQYHLSEVYGTLADRFQDTRLALNDMGERLVSTNDPDCNPALLCLGVQD